MDRIYFEKSSTTATLQHCPARLVPPPRERTGASKFAADGDGGFHVGSAAWHYNSDGNLAVVRCVSCVESARGLVEADFSADCGSETRFKLA